MSKAGGRRLRTLGRWSALRFIPLVLLCAYPIFCTYDLSRSNMQFYDFLSMNSNVVWFAIVLAILVAVGLWRSGDVTLPSLLAVTLFFSVAEVWTNYPAIFARDVYLHGSAVKGMIDQGAIPNTWNPYPREYPGFFLVWSAVTLVTNAEIRFGNLFILLPYTVLALTILIFVFYRRLGISFPGAATLLTFLLMNYTDNEFSLLHFNTRIYSLVLVLVLIFILVVGREAPRAATFSTLAVNMTLAISHVLNSLVAVVFVAVYWLMQRAKYTLTLVAVCGVCYFAWSYYAATAYWGLGVSTLLAYIREGIALEWTSQYVPRLGYLPSMPYFGVLLATYYKMLLAGLALLSLFCAARFRKHATVSVMISYMIAIILVYGGTVFSASPVASVNRGILFGSICLAAMPMYLFSQVAKSGRRFSRHLIVLTLLVFLIVPHVVLVHEESYALYGNTQPLNATSTFISEYGNNQPIVALGDFEIYYCFYEPFFTRYETAGLASPAWSSLDGIVKFMVNTPEPSALLVLDGYRKAADWTMLGNAQSYAEARAQWNGEVYSKLDMQYNRIFTDSFVTLYHKGL